MSNVFWNENSYWMGLVRLALEVDAGPGVVEAAADGKLVLLLVDPGVELRQGANVERDLPILGREAEAVVVEVVVGLDRQLAEMGITDLLGTAMVVGSPPPVAEPPPALGREPPVVPPARVALDLVTSGTAGNRWLWSRFTALSSWTSRESSSFRFVTRRDVAPS